MFEFAEFNGGVHSMPGLFMQMGNAKPARGQVLAKVLNEYNMSCFRIDRLISGFPVLRNKQKAVIIAATTNSNQCQHTKQ